MYQWKVKVSSAFHDMRHGLNLYRFLCVPHRSQGFFFPGASRSEGFNVCNKIRQTCASIVIILCVSPALIIVSESFMIVSYSIKYQCPGVTVPKCRRFWRALICLLIPRSCDFISYAKMKPKKLCGISMSYSYHSTHMALTEGHLVHESQGRLLWVLPCPA